MASADNVSYKNMYHFNYGHHDYNHGFHYGYNYNETDKERLPSLESIPEINDKIKENPYRSNVEIEKDELVLNPDLTAIFKAVGKKHSGGGIDVNLKPNSFVFSNDKELAFTEKDHDLFEFKKGGSFAKTKNTPADVLKRNVDIKHYNKMVNIITDPAAEDINKRTATMMLEKYIQSLGNVAFLQEQKKDFPDGIPDFAQDSAPVYDTELKDTMMQQKQYARYGGNVKAQMGLWAAGKALKSQVNPNQIQLEYLRQQASRQALGNEVDDPTQDYGALYNNLLQQTPQAPLNTTPLVRGDGQPKQGKYSGVEPLTPSTDLPRIPGRAPGVPQIVAPPKIKVPEGTPTAPTTLGVPLVTGTPQGSKTADWRFTPEQRISQGYNLFKLASAKRYMPYRSHFNASFVDPNLVNPEQAVGDLQTASNQALAGVNQSLSPILRNAQAQGIYGDLLNKLPGVRSAYDNQNAQILNQTAQYNNQIKNQATQTNMQNDQTYYQQTIAGQANFDNMRNYLGDQYMNNRTQDVMDNQKLAYSLLAQNNPAYRFNWDTGYYDRTNKSIMDAQGDAKSDMYTEVASSLLAKQRRGEKLSKEDLDFFKALSLGKIQMTPRVGKRGGTYNPYK